MSVVMPDFFIQNIMATMADSNVVQRLTWIDSPDKLPRSKGVYVLVMQLTYQISIHIGKRGEYKLLPATYFYVGSARGAGGLYSRVHRHWRNDTSKAKRWHVDYLRAPMQLLGCWVITDSNNGNNSKNKNDSKNDNKNDEQDKIAECALAQLFACHPSLSSFADLGSSDCRCLSHVFYLL